MWTLQWALLSPFWFWLVLKRLFWADQNTHSLISTTERAPVLWRASFPAWHVQSLQRLYQIQIYMWLWMLTCSPLTRRFFREGIHNPPVPPPTTTLAYHPFPLSFSLPASTQHGCYNTHALTSASALKHCEVLGLLYFSWDTNWDTN